MIDDSKIIAGCKKNKHKFQMALFDKYAPMLRAVCLRYATNTADADDLLQEGFIKILDNISKYTEKGSFTAWIKKIVVNNAINYYRKQTKYRFDEINENLHSFDDDEQSDNKIETRILDANIDPEQIIEIFRDLPDGYRMVLNLYVIDGYSHNEIAEKLGISVSTSKSQLSRARKTLIKKTEIIINQMQEQ
ncbi:MAG: RNA polymerase sigma factor [Bacteroidales bacterium]|nr:RNA polymerase sigma factor [Bacteroidales bacterium]MDD4215707.1 RNA polymerase sigma factor [Bacteroidales bacterium]MDY0140314.1 RNA polymerase sigma factor [Bacteroidales bacterium]